MSDDDDTVYVTRNASQRTTYHTTKCISYPDNPGEWDRATAEAWGMTECEECKRGEYRRGERNPQLVRTDNE